jgi:hypothetical protein
MGFNNDGFGNRELLADRLDFLQVRIKRFGLPNKVSLQAGVIAEVIMIGGFCLMSGVFMSQRGD